MLQCIAQFETVLEAPVFSHYLVMLKVGAELVFFGELSD